MAYVILRKHPDGSHGLVKIYNLNTEQNLREAREQVQGWLSYLPHAHLIVAEVEDVNSCFELNNKDGFKKLDRVF